MVQRRISSPVGELLLTANDDGLTGVWFEEHRYGPADLRSPVGSSTGSSAADDILRTAAGQLAEYFQGRRITFNLPLAPRGTPFQMRVWRALRDIPFGETISYGELAGRIGQVRAIRAVGGANGRNPLSIVVPCHRVIGADGSLTGFGGGVERKRWLLDHERALEATQVSLFGAQRGAMSQAGGAWRAPSPTHP